ncbi:MAG: hypothetical protein H0X26_06645 [Alphaproteobacteria bacterium]|nr:hypothetical protein [Alphaproteobacteria bacterium]
MLKKTKSPANKRIKRYGSFVKALLVSSSLITSAYGMTDDDYRNHNWSVLLTQVDRGSLGSKVLSYLDDRSLARAAQVSNGWSGLVHGAREQNQEVEKEKLYSLVLEVTNAEPNEVQQAHDQLENFLETSKEVGQAEQRAAHFKNLVNLKPRLLQPESLIRKNGALFNQLLSASELQETHPALKPLVTLIEDLHQIIKTDKTYGVQKLLAPLVRHYEAYLHQLLSPKCDRAVHLHPKALLSGEGFLGDKQGVTSFRLSQSMARALLSKDEYGLSAKTNIQGSHAVSFKRSLHNKDNGVHFKGNTTNTGLPVGRESAMYALSQSLFKSAQGGLSVSSLLSLSEVEINTPLEGTDVYKAFNEALSMGKTSEEFFMHYPHYEKEFTKKDPSHVLQAGLHVEGVSLEDFMEGVDKGTYSYDGLDPTSFSEHILLSMLTNPTDGTPGNFMLRLHEFPHHQRKFSIMGIDNDMALELGDVFSEKVQSKFKPGQKMTTSQKHSVRVKNILMCLPLMEQPLASSTVKRILNLNPELCAMEWLTRLKLQNIRYAQLEKAQYTSDHSTQRREAYLSPTFMTDLHLPFLLDPDFIPEFCQTIKKVQAYLADNRAASHWQLLLNIHPLSSRFYQEMIKLSDGSAIKAYLKIDPRYRKHDPNIPARDVTYLEDVLTLKEKLLSGQTVEDTLKNVTARSDGTIKFTQTIEEAARDSLSKADLFQQPFLNSFLKAGIESFGDLIHPQSKSTLHSSWSKNVLLFKVISEGISVKYIRKLLELGLDVSITDTERRTVIRHAVERNSAPDLLDLLKDAYLGDCLIAWLNTVASDQLTALDVALEKKDPSTFKKLISYGASTCHPNIALKFYQRVIRTIKDPDVKQAFLKLMDINDEVRWTVCLDEMLPNYTSGQIGTPIDTAKYGKRLLPNWVKSQIMDDNNQWLPYTNEGNHIVCRATMGRSSGKEQALYFKVYPELPGIEEAVGLLTRKLIRHGAPHTELININGLPVLVSHSHGSKETTLDYIMRKSPEILKNLDEESLSGLILVAMLINPEDGKPTNYVIEGHPTKENKYRIVGIDNDHAFVPAIVMEKPKKEFWTGKPLAVAQVKTILYCLDQMKNPVHPNIRSMFINLHADETFDEWLRELKKVNTSYSDLFLDPQDHVNFFRDKEHQSFLGIPFQKGAISHLYDKFVTLRNALNQSPDMTHMELLMKLEPRLAKRYSQASQLSTVKDRWDAVDADFYEKTKSGSGTTITRSGDVLKSMDIPLEESVFNSIRLGKALGPIQALEELKVITQELQTKTLEELGARAGNLNILKTLQLESTRARFLKATDFKNLSLQQEESILNYLKDKQLRDLTLKNCKILNDIKLTETFSLNHLLKLDIRGCESITYRSLVHLSKSALILEELNLSHIKSLKEIVSIGAFTDTPLIFKELRFLNLSDCNNLSKIFIQAPKLHYLNIGYCVRLTDQMLDGIIEYSENLQKLVFEGCPLIKVRDLREQYPNFPASYCGIEGSVVSEILESTTQTLELGSKKIDMSSQGSIAFGRALKINPGLSFLTSLDLQENNIDDEWAKAISQGNLFTLLKLNLEKNRIRKEGAKFLSTGNLLNLTSLNLSENKIEDEGTQSISVGNFRTLTDLNIQFNDMGDIGISALGTGKLNVLKSLNLQRNFTNNKTITHEGVQWLVTEKLTGLTFLDLHEHSIGVLGAALLSNGTFRFLTTLDLYNNNIGDSGAALLANGNLLTLTSLNLFYNNIGDDGLMSLANGNLSNLTELGLGRNHPIGVFTDNINTLSSVGQRKTIIGPEGAKFLANGNLANLTSLDLFNHDIGPYGAASLANGKIIKLRKLHLHNNNIGPVGANSLANGNLSSLTDLHLYHNDIGDEGVASLANGNLSSLTDLNLYNNNISDDGAVLLAKGNLSSLISLSLGRHGIISGGVTSMANGNFSTLMSLRFWTSGIGDKGAMSLVNGNLPSLTSIDLHDNVMTDAGIQAFKEKLSLYQRLIQLRVAQVPRTDWIEIVPK